MNIRQKIWIDRFFGKFAADTLNFLARIAGALLRRDHALPQSYNRIAVCKLIGMGSIIQATPLLHSIKLNFPASELIFISSRSNAPILERVPWVDTVVSIDDTSFLSLFLTSVTAVLRLWRMRADLYFDLEVYSNFSSILTVMSFAPNRAGYYKGTFAYSRGIYTHMMYFNIKAPIAHVYLQLARLAGCREFCEELEHFPVYPYERESFHRKLSGAGIELPQQYLVFNPNASDLRIERRWEGKNYALLAEKIIANDDRCTIVFIGTEKERPLVGSILERIPAIYRCKCCNSAGMFSLGELCALLDESELIVTNDSGPLHLAAALKKRVVGLFGPCSPTQYGRVKGVVPVYKNVYCSPCVHEFDVPPCHGDNACMEAIPVDEVFAIVNNVRGNLVAAHDAEAQEITYANSLTSRPLGIVERRR